MHDRKTLEVERSWFKRNVRQATKIKLEESAMNRDHGYKLYQSTTNCMCHVILEVSTDSLCEYEFMKACHEQ